ncbi:MAG: CpaD family pilus assembly protein [Parvibaculaceae bacterium]
MTTLGSKIGGLKLLALVGIALGIAGCKSTEPDIDDFYVPTAHYERHPIIVTKSGAHAKACGDWSEDLTETAQNDQYKNFGCAQQSNLAAMVANPRDLERPRTQTPSDPMRRSKIFDNYREGEKTAAQQEDQQKVQISTVGGSGGGQ